MERLLSRLVRWESSSPLEMHVHGMVHGPVVHSARAVHDNGCCVWVSQVATSKLFETAGQKHSRAGHVPRGTWQLLLSSTHGSRRGESMQPSVSVKSFYSLH